MAGGKWGRRVGEGGEYRGGRGKLLGQHDGVVRLGVRLGIYGYTDGNRSEKLTGGRGISNDEQGHRCKWLSDVTGCRRSVCKSGYGWEEDASLPRRPATKWEITGGLGQIATVARSSRGKVSMAINGELRKKADSRAREVKEWCDDRNSITSHKKRSIAGRREGVFDFQEVGGGLGSAVRISFARSEQDIASVLSCSSVVDRSCGRFYASEKAGESCLQVQWLRSLRRRASGGRIMGVSVEYTRWAYSLPVKASSERASYLRVCGGGWWLCCWIRSYPFWVSSSRENGGKTAEDVRWLRRESMEGEVLEAEEDSIPVKDPRERGSRGISDEAAEWSNRVAQIVLCQRGSNLGDSRVKLGVKRASEIGMYRGKNKNGKLRVKEQQDALGGQEID
ncbi:hypothetical protein Tco_0801760 [Tanacetum coccineum]|uniref:Uncharacterized protein n=1 Tax=Tanacetum coccineum TaxID=301880 RepID=A0ABQ5A0E9_9ASTR